MKKWIWSSIILFILCVTLGNIYLMNKYEDKIYNVVSVSEFAKPKQGDLRNILTKDGVVTANKEEKIAYNSEIGLIDEILVEEGDQVKAGTSLFQYETKDIERLQQQLKQKIEIAEAERGKISKDIIALGSYKGTIANQTPEQKEADEVNKVIINSQVRELELRDELLELDIEDYENQLDVLETEVSSLTVTSTIDGIVKKINPSTPLEMITIVEYPFVVQGVLSEKELKNVSVGQKAFVTNEGLQHEGTITHISQFPIESPSLKQKISYFSFSVMVTKEVELLPFGHHLGIDIVEEESENTIYVQTGSVFRSGKEKGTLFIEKNGKLEKVKVDLGIQQGSKIEIINGLKGRELVILKPSNEMKSGTPIVLPLDDTKFHKKQLEEIGKREVAATIGKALLGIN